MLPQILSHPLDFLKWLKVKSQKKITQKTQNPIDKICKNAPKKRANRKRLIIPFDNLIKIIKFLNIKIKNLYLIKKKLV
jgi:hypothetical protein